MSQARKIAATLIKELERWGAYEYYVASTGSVYVKFPHWGLGSIRIANHRGIQKYDYRWNVDLTKKVYIMTQKTQKTQHTTRMFFGTESLRELVGHFEYAASKRGIKPGDKETWTEREAKINKQEGEPSDRPTGT